MKSLLAALVGIIAFAAPLAILMVALFAFEPFSGWLLLPYCVLAFIAVLRLGAL
jgi:tryptophan-rich sensory protein